ncbi:MAG: hypothetical protein L6Q99_01415 [Planctomycetes bacterium]|nr:hypothetical protein [Planctomycetota bacterium]
MQRSPGRVAVLIGASNLAQGLEHALAGTFARLGSDARVFVACGRGRSYGLRSAFVFRGLPAVLDCGLWRALDVARDVSRDTAPAAALFADVGNDLAYGVEPERVLAWLRRTAERVGAERMAFAGLPLASLARLSPAAIAFWARVIFPARRFDAGRVLAHAVELDQRVRELARELGGAYVELPVSWYGRDPIHVARPARRAAWNTLLAAFGAPHHAVPPLSGWSLVGLAAEERTLCGVPLGRAQPCRRFAGGGELSLY